MKMSEALEIKGEMLTMSILYLKTIDLKWVEETLALRVQKAPAFFNQIPVIVDLSHISELDRLDFQWLKNLLLSHSLVPVALRSVPEKLVAQAIKADWAFISDRERGIVRDDEPQIDQAEARVKPTADTGQRTVKDDESLKSDISAKTIANEIPPKEIEVIREVRVPTKVVKQQVRSGQQVAVTEGDLIVLNTVNEGAELLAAGNIHVYGALRGRAVAGMNGDKQVRIFCQSLEAELVSIAGQYSMLDSETIKKWRGQAVQIFLEDETLKIESLI